VTAQLPESTLLVWYCRSCDKSCKVQPPDAEQIACKCTSPVPGLRPTRVTLMHAPKPRPIQALTEEEGRLRALARKGTKVRVTYEAEVSEAWTTADSDGIKRVQFIVTTPDGRRHVADPRLPGLRIEAVTEEDV
jgi:hypothetical protein